MWDPPRPGPEPASPALAGRFSTTAPPGKPPHLPLTLDCGKGERTQGWCHNDWNENPDSISYHSSDLSHHSSNQSVISSSQTLTNVFVSWPLLLDASCTVHVCALKFQCLYLGLGFVPNPQGAFLWKLWCKALDPAGTEPQLALFCLSFTEHRSLLVLVADEWTRPLLISRSKEAY